MRSEDARDDSGAALFSVLAASVLLGGLVYSTTMLAHVELVGARRGLDRVRALYVAQSGVERSVDELLTAARLTAVMDPLTGVRALFTDNGGTLSAAPYHAEPLTDGTDQVGQYTVTMTAEHRDDGYDVTIVSTGYVPAAPETLPNGARRPVSRTVETTVRIENEPARVFDNSYFINNWGWFYGNTIHAMGNARSNGQFDAANYAPEVTGQPLYDDVAWGVGGADLQGYQDDNGDGLQDGNDGGIFAGWDIVRASKVVGNGGNTDNQHEFQDQVAMPNLSDLTRYESLAISSGGTISVGGTTVVDGVCGDDPGELQNLYLVGTADDPIVINGPVVVRGHVIISGVVKGQGAIYSGGNVYIPNDLEYADPPATARPTDNSEAATESWMTANRDKDFLGVFARENIVLGDHTTSTWQSNVGGWLASSLNSSKEDAGEDGIPNTAKGRDGVAGTADDDVLEGDGVFTVEHYTEAEQAAGLIPAGHSVGDAVPGSGEDIDGDGQYDPTLTTSDLVLTVPINSSNFAGNAPASTIDFHSIASNKMTRVDGAFYTNHAFAWLTVPSDPINVNGAVVSRNESIIYGGPGLYFNYDCRMLGGKNSICGSLLPRTLAPVRTLSWHERADDPNRVTP